MNMSNHKFYVIVSLCLAGYAIALKINTCFVWQNKINIYQRKISAHVLVLRMRTGVEIYWIFKRFHEFFISPKTVCVQNAIIPNNITDVIENISCDEEKNYDWWFYDKSSLFHISIFFHFMYLPFALSTNLISNF